MPHLLLVLLGGAIGAGCRYGVGKLAVAQFGTGFPWGTLIVNLLGGFLAGLVLAAGERSEPLRHFLGVGLLGGFTTFSAFSVETASLLQRGELGMAAAYSFSSVIGAVLLLFAGLWLARGGA